MTTPIERLLAKTDVPGLLECWTWRGGRTGRNRKYGRFRVGGSRHGGVRACVHRFSYEYFVGPIPDGHEIDHVCENTLCINPAHLTPVAPEVNKSLRYGKRDELRDADLDELNAMLDGVA